MEINAIKSIRLKVPLNQPMRTRYYTLEHTFCLLVILQTDTGLEGQGLVRAVDLPAVNIMNEFINSFYSHSLLQTNFTSPEEIWRTLWLQKRNFLQSGFGLYALAAIDIAIWDIKAKIENKPLFKLLHNQKDYVIPYGNGGWLIDTKQELLNEVKWYLERGCNHFKMRIGSDNDISRIKLLRETFGDELLLSADANQYYKNIDEALEMSKRLADFNIVWFEEPLFSNSLIELSRLSALSPVPIATGENMNTHWQIQDVCQLKAAQILQPDVIYQGGITEFVKSAKIIRDHDLILGPHLFHELSSNFAGLCPKNYIEHLDFFPHDLFTHDFRIKEGKIMLSNVPGHGVTLSKQAIEKYQI